MSNYYFGAPHVAPLSAQSAFPGPAPSNAHNNRSRRAARFNTSQKPPKQPKTHRPQQDSADESGVTSCRRDFEAARSFDLEDDEIFCPWHLLTDDDLQSIHSTSSDRASSSGSGSPDTSPRQPQTHPPSLMAPPTSSHMAAHFQPGNTSHFKIHQPLAQRTRNAIPIVDPNSRNASPPTSVSPARHAQKSTYLARRW